jgi:hypothetical protein
MENVVKLVPDISRKEAVARALEDTAREVREGTVVFVVGTYLRADGKMTYIQSGHIEMCEDILKINGCLSHQIANMNEILFEAQNPDLDAYDGEDPGN